MNESNIRVHRQGETVLIVEPGPMLDNYAAPELLEVFSDAAGKQVKTVIVNMAGVDFMSSAGAGALVGNVELFRGVGGDLIVCNASPTILHVFQLLDLADYLTIKADLAEAQEFAGSLSGSTEVSDGGAVS